MAFIDGVTNRVTTSFQIHGAYSLQYRYNKAESLHRLFALTIRFILSSSSSFLQKPFFLNSDPIINPSANLNFEIFSALTPEPMNTGILTAGFGKICNEK